MNSLVEARVRTFLTTRLHRDAYEGGAIMFNIRKLSRVAGHDTDRRFAQAGLATGPDARVASAIVDQATGGGGGGAVSHYEMNQTIDRWVQKTPPMGL
jgi:hypothetical protein